MKLHHLQKNTRAINRYKKIENEFNLIHNFKYDYSQSIYKDTQTKIKIICKTHGIFEQTPDSHLQKHGCPKCGGGIKITQESFIEKAKKTHRNLYDYSLVDYKTAHKKIKIICKFHGVFEQTPASHYNWKRGCPSCSQNKRLNTDEFIEKSKNTHGDKYDYSLSEYTTSKNKIKIICKTHGVFEQIAQEHYFGKGCFRCAGKDIDTLEFIKKSKEVHGERYDYSLSKYKTSDTKVKIRCKKHGIFLVTPSNHYKRNCPSCAKYGFNQMKSGTLYYLSVNSGQAYKVGITNRTTTERFIQDKNDINIIKEWYFESGQECKSMETKILNEYKYAKWDGDDLLDSGNTELFKYDVLGLDA